MTVRGARERAGGHYHAGRSPTPVTGSHMLPPAAQGGKCNHVPTRAVYLTSFGQNSSLQTALDCPGILRLYTPAPSDLAVGSSAQVHHHSKCACVSTGDILTVSILSIGEI